MGEGIARSRPPECRRRRLGQQARPDRLGGAAARREICRPGVGCGGVGLGRSETLAPVDRGCLRVVNRRWPNSRMAFWKPGLKNGARRREFYEDRNARISILAQRLTLKPDTLKQTGYSRRSR